MTWNQTTLIPHLLHMNKNEYFLLSKLLSQKFCNEMLIRRMTMCTLISRHEVYKLQGRRYFTTNTKKAVTKPDSRIGGPGFDCRPGVSPSQFRKKLWASRLPKYGQDCIFPYYFLFISHTHGYACRLRIPYSYTDNKRR